MQLISALVRPALMMIAVFAVLCGAGARAQEVEENWAQCATDAGSIYAERQAAFLLFPVGQAFDFDAVKREARQRATAAYPQYIWSDGRCSIGPYKQAIGWHNTAIEEVRVNNRDRGSNITIFELSEAGASGPTQRLTLNFRGSSQFASYTEGYTYANIGVDYQFIACAGEIQVALALKQDSLRYSPTYEVRGPTGALSTSRPASRPVVNSVRLRGVVNGGPPYHAPIPIDVTVYEALGMGCFTGQTFKIGLVRDLVGPNATPPQIIAYLQTLRIQTSGLDVPLTNAAGGEETRRQGARAPQQTSPTPRALEGRSPAEREALGPLVQ